MKFLTIITAMSGHGGHTAARKIAENNPEYRWYDHPRNNKDYLNKFPELNLAPNHFRKRFKDNTVFPHLFDRIETFLLDKEKYYSLVLDEINLLSKGKCLVYVCHETPKKIKSRFPQSKVIQILPPEQLLEQIIERHMETHMLYPLQDNLHSLSNRKDLLNDLYWNQLAWIEKNQSRNNTINFRCDTLNKFKDQVVTEESMFQKELYMQQLASRKDADVSFILENVNEGLEKSQWTKAN